MNAITIITDHKGGFPSRAYSREPEPGSVVLTEGLFGTAWQRFFSDGRWHPTRGGGSRTWEQLITKRNVVLVYDAEIRADQGSLGMSMGKMACDEQIVARYNFEEHAQEAALARTISTGTTHYFREDAETATFVVYIVEQRFPRNCCATWSTQYHAEPCDNYGGR